jgi:cell division protein FtsB
MARNRKYRSAAIRFGPALKAFLLCLFFAGSGVGYVWQKNQLLELGKQIKQRETRLAALAQQNEKLKKQLATMRSPAFLEDRIKDLKLGLVQPLPSQIWRLPEPAREWPGSDSNRQLVSQGGRVASAP